MEASINLNDFVYVRINERGWKVMEEHYKELFRGHEPPSGIEGYLDIFRKSTHEMWVDGELKPLTKIQLHEFIGIFGKEMYCGAESVIENNRIYLIVS